VAGGGGRVREAIALVVLLGTLVVRHRGDLAVDGISFLMRLPSLRQDIVLLGCFFARGPSNRSKRRRSAGSCREVWCGWR
jgi:hypothetical protein